MAVSLSGDFKANLAQLPDVDGIESITLTFKDTGERCGFVRPASWRPCMCSRRGVYRRGFLNLLTGDLCADVIENKPGKSGSVKVYNYLLQQFPGLHKSIVELRTRATGRAGAPIPRSTKPRVLSPGSCPAGGEITRQAAYLGVAVYAEHVEDSHSNPGKHPNIDRLFNVINSGRTLCATVKNM